MAIPERCQERNGFVMSGDGRMEHIAQFLGYLDGIHSQYRDMVGGLVMRGVRTCMDGGG